MSSVEGVRTASQFVAGSAKILTGHRGRSRHVHRLTVAEPKSLIRYTNCFIVAVVPLPRNGWRHQRIVIFQWNTYDVLDARLDGFAQRPRRLTLKVLVFKFKSVTFAEVDDDLRWRIRVHGPFEWERLSQIVILFDVLFETDFIRDAHFGQICIFERIKLVQGRPVIRANGPAARNAKL